MALLAARPTQPFCQISGITSFRPRNVEAIKEREVIWLPFKITLMLQMEQRLKQICLCINLIPSSHLSPFPPIKYGSFKGGLKLRDLREQKIDLL